MSILKLKNKILDIINIWIGKITFTDKKSGIQYMCVIEWKRDEIVCDGVAYHRHGESDNYHPIGRLHDGVRFSPS